MTFLRNVAAAILPDAAWNAARSAKSYVGGRATLAACADQIRTHFPALGFRHARMINSGVDYVVLVLDDAWVFRFPRNERRRLALGYEIRLLTQLRAITAIDLPHYTHAAPDNAFGGYPIIAGDELTGAALEAADRVTQEKALTQFTDFLNTLHALPAILADANDATRGLLHNADISNWYFNHKREYLALKIDAELLGSLDRFYQTFHAAPAFEPRLIHGDIDDHHLLLNRQTGRLGMIDFGDVTTGDPAIDFAMLWSYPDWARSFVVDRYAFARQDPDLLARAKSHYTRRLCDRLWNGLRRQGHPRSLDETIRTLRQELSLLGY